MKDEKHINGTPVSHKGVVYPSVTALMQVTGAARTTISRHLDRYGHLDFLDQRKSGRSAAHGKMKQIDRMRSAGASLREIERKTGLSYGSVRRAVKDLEAAQ